ncbi:MAG TPA: M23 family metallopeptidase [Thermotogaceae bacterium]|nr:M23 family metallopeptidase [Thermotogota bacterium]HEW91967.1 M23 family metallopeptidase [Thermotogaceae bacterium]
MKKVILLFIVFSIIFTFYSFASVSYFLPVKNFKTYLTSAFGEYRPSMTKSVSHFHMGVDFSTAYRSGVPIAAVTDGYIEKIDIDDDDIYGYTVYIRHDDGYLSVYAHLSKFGDNLSYLFESLKKEFGKNRIEIFFSPNEIRVKKGEIIGFSGQTGEALAPHCHLEIRDTQKNIAINPLNFLSDFVTAPKGDIRILGLRINGREVSIADKIHYFTGSLVNMEINATLKTDRNSLGLYKIELYMDGVLVYQILFDEISFDDFEAADVLFGRNSNASNYWYKLYSPETLSVVKLNKLPIEFPSESAVKIVVEDFWGRSKELKFRLLRR